MLLVVLAIVMKSGEAFTSTQAAHMFCPAEQRVGFKLHHSNLSVIAPEDTKYRNYLLHPFVRFLTQTTKAKAVSLDR